jgi:transposase-like protein
VSVSKLLRDGGAIGNGIWHNRHVPLGSAAENGMAKHRSHSIEFKRRVAQEFIAGETLHSLAKRQDVSRNLIRIWVKKLEAGTFDEVTRAADLLQEYEAKIAALAATAIARSRGCCAMRAGRSTTSGSSGSGDARG